MEKPCKHCEKAIPELTGEAFEQECYETCDRFEQYADGASKALDKLLTQGIEILERHGIL